MDPVETRDFAPALGQSGRYQLQAELGHGAMGTVYLARDTHLDRQVAIKVLPPHCTNDPGAVARFRREAKALARLSHPAIVQAYDTGEMGDKHFLVMEYVEGTSLAGVLKDKGRLPPTQAAAYIYQAAGGLEHAHVRGLVHRDLKPSNLLLTCRGEVKILDLGLARFLQDQIEDPGLTRENTGLGTPDYAAPEQFRNAHDVDGRADIYALGCTLYHFVTGRVPFPGSSLSEKCEGHEHQEPPAVEDLCPEMPGGLALVIRRMMAKRPAERFQTAREVAEALAPYVAGSSAAFGRLKNTATWHGSQLTVQEFKHRGRRRRWAIAAAAAALAFVGFTGLWFFLNHEPPDGSDQKIVSRSGKESKAPGSDSEKRRRQVPRPAGKLMPADPNVLTVSQDPRGGGNYRTITAALSKVKAGQTIRVLDSAVYREELVIQRSSTQAGIWLESSRRATLETRKRQGYGIRIVGVGGVSVRGFRLRAESEKATLIGIGGHCPGTVLEDLEMEPGRGHDYDGIFVGNLHASPNDDPIVVRHCIFRRPKIGIAVLGIEAAAGGISIQDNRLWEPNLGVHVFGRARNVQVVANRIWGAAWSGLQLQHLDTEAKDILFANNTVLDSSSAFRLWDDSVKGKNIQVCNNLFLGKPEDQDMVFIDSGEKLVERRGPGDGKQAQRAWRLARNWRELKPTKDWGKSWIPPSNQDVVRKHIAVKSRDPDSADFLRPARDSPLATGGAGETDPSLPLYVGAVPPEGLDPWDWRRTWQVWPPGALLTVSKDPQAGGKYRTIREALAVAKPWATIRILDGAVYSEAVVIDDPAKQEGIALQAPQRATLAFPGAGRGLVIRGVPRVRVTGIRLRGDQGVTGAPFVLVSSHCPGVVLDRLDIQTSKPCYGILLDKAWAAPGEEPVIVQHCRIKAVAGIYVLGQKSAAEAPGAKLRGVEVRNNWVHDGYKGILIQGAVTDVLVAGNVAGGSWQAALQIEDLGPGSDRILIANNTLLESGTLFRVWDNPPPKKLVPGAVELRNNLLFGGGQGDMVCFLREAGGDGACSLKRNKAVARAWLFGQNWRDLTGTDDSIPLAPRDKKLEKIGLVSLDPLHSDYLRPAAKSLLATGGAGKDEPSLPTYVGAVPPEGVEAWDWDTTWRDRAERPRALGIEGSKKPSSAENKADAKK
jgi:serine/threonine protein kinase